MSIHPDDCIFDACPSVRNNTGESVSLLMNDLQVLEDEGSKLPFHEGSIQNELGFGLPVEHETDSLPKPPSVQDEVGFCIRFERKRERWWVCS